MNKKTSSLEVIKEIQGKIHNLPDGPFWITDIVRDKKYTFPVTLYVGDGRHIHINPDISGLISSLSKTVLLQYFNQHRTDFTDKDWEDMTRRAFGEALVNPDEDTVPDKDPKEILSGMRSRLKGWIGEIREREYAFGFDFCNVESLDPLDIGPVTIEPRNTWLNKAYDRGYISEEAFLRVQMAWKGEILREREYSDDEMREQEILRTVGDSLFVCSVRVGKSGSESGRKKALTAAHIAMTVISLSWITPSYAMNDSGLAYDRPAYRQSYLVLFPENNFGWSISWSNFRNGIAGLSPKEWEELLIELKTRFSCAGEVITYLINGPDSVIRPEVMSMLYQALLWFHEGCREEEPAMAIVKFCAVLEALSCGRNKKGILSLANARLTITNRRLFGKRLGDIYKEGRSRTIHGTSKKLRQDLGADCRFMEDLCRKCLLSCLEYATDNPNLGNTDLFMEGSPNQN
ncbi:MAG: hypothetical protein F4206_13355 [Gammaproteobacteria bacterium]|nr:hypothetical protein [Gammaproteobacteria bacterium]